jgi:hypothetical protein
MFSSLASTSHTSRAGASMHTDPCASTTPEVWHCDFRDEPSLSGNCVTLGMEVGRLTTTVVDEVGVVAQWDVDAVAGRGEQAEPRDLVAGDAIVRAGLPLGTDLDRRM